MMLITTNKQATVVSVHNLSKAKVIMILLLVCLSLLQLGSSITKCDPVADCITSGIGGKVPDPTNCKNFYGCIDNGAGLPIPSTLTLTCQAGYFFDANSLNCQPEINAGHCETNLCAQIRGQQCLNKCPAFRSGSSSELPLVADPRNCSVYYICTGSSPIMVSCGAPTPYFNGTVCVAESYKCCDFCTPYCYEVGTQRADPYDSSAFYICLNVGPPTDFYKVTCPTGTYYEESSLTCVTGTLNPLCIP